MTAAQFVRLEAAERITAEPPRPLYRQVAPAEPFPVEALGPALAGAARAIEEATQASDAICANAVLGAAALATQGIADVRLPTRQTRPLSLSLLTVAGSGERKTSADNEALRGVRDRERELREEFETEFPKYRNAKDAWEAARTAALKGGKGNLLAIREALERLGPEPLGPLKPILVAAEPTTEGLVKLLADGSPSIGVFSSEGGSFIGGHAMNDDAKLRSAARLSSLWDGCPIDRIRSGDGASVLVSAFGPETEPPSSSAGACRCT